MLVLTAAAGNTGWHYLLAHHSGYAPISPFTRRRRVALQRFFPPPAGTQLNSFSPMTVASTFLPLCVTCGRSLNDGCVIYALALLPGQTIAEYHRAKGVADRIFRTFEDVGGNILVTKIHRVFGQGLCLVHGLSSFSIGLFRGLGATYRRLPKEDDDWNQVQVTARSA